MKKTILMGFAALIVMSGANMTAFAQRIPGTGLQQASYMNAKQLNNLSSCGPGGCSTAPMMMGSGCAAEPRGCNIGCGAPAPIACCPLSALKNIPCIIPSISVPDCGSPAPCLQGMKDAIGRVFLKADPECKPSCVAPVAPTPGACRITSPGFASIQDNGDCNSGTCDTGTCDDGSCGPAGYGCSICSGLGGACGGGLCGSGQFSLFPDQGWNMPVKTPITRNPVSYSRYQPSNWYGSAGGGYSGNFPMVYRPTDTTQLGFISHNVPYWKRTRSPGMPAPASIHSRNCPSGAYSSYGQGYDHRSHHSYPWFRHHGN